MNEHCIADENENMPLPETIKTAEMVNNLKTDGLNDDIDDDLLSEAEHVMVLLQVT